MTPSPCAVPNDTVAPWTARRTKLVSGLILVAFMLTGSALVTLIEPVQVEAQSRKAKAKKKRKGRRVIPLKSNRRGGKGGLYLRYGLGFGGCLDESDPVCPSPAQNTEGGGVDSEFGPGFFDLELGYRPRPGYFGVELQISQNQYELLSDTNRTFDAAFLYGGLGLKLFPLKRNRVDPYLNVRVGGMSVTRDNAQDALDEGFMFSILGGVDYLFTRNFGLGTSLGSHWLQGEDNNHSFWTWRVSLVIYFDVEGSGRRRVKPKKVPRKPKERY